MGLSPLLPFFFVGNKFYKQSSLADGSALFCLQVSSSVFTQLLNSGFSRQVRCGTKMWNFPLSKNVFFQKNFIVILKFIIIPNTAKHIYAPIVKFFNKHR